MANPKYDDDAPVNDSPQGRDAAHFEDPTVRAVRRAGNRPDDGNAFVPDPSTNEDHRLAADDADSFAEEFIAAATTADDSVTEDARDEVSTDEDGGPFLVVSENDDEVIADIPDLEPGPRPDTTRPRRPFTRRQGA